MRWSIFRKHKQMMKNSLSIGVYGQVQGVGFRYEAKEKADELGLKGFARNEPDGSVSIEVEGEEENLRKFLSWCESGHSTVRPDKIDFNSSDEFKNYRGFEIK